MQHVIIAIMWDIYKTPFKIELAHTISSWFLVDIVRIPSLWFFLSYKMPPPPPSRECCIGELIQSCHTMVYDIMANRISPCRACLIRLSRGPSSRESLTLCVVSHKSYIRSIFSRIVGDTEHHKDSSLPGLNSRPSVWWHQPLPPDGWYLNYLYSGYLVSLCLIFCSSFILTLISQDSDRCMAGETRTT